jgi:hypothetical protein
MEAKRFALPGISFLLALSVLFSAFPATYAAEKEKSDTNEIVIDNTASFNALMDSLSPKEKAQFEAVTASIVAQETEEAKKKAAGEDFKGLGFSAAVAVSFYGDSRIQTAELIDGYVRVTERSNITTTLMLETHYFFTKGPQVESRWGVGPYIGIVSSNSEIIDAFSIGCLLGLRPSLDNRKSFNIGAGIVWDPNGTKLGNGLNENEPLPDGTTDLYYESGGMAGFQIMASFSF